MMSRRSPNLVLGWCFSAAAIASISVLIWAYTAFESSELVQIACAAPISIEKEGSVRLGCAPELDTEQCKGVQPGDHVRWVGGRCEIVSGGMASQFRLAARLPLDLNQVTMEDLQFLEGVGPVLARAVVGYRSANGPFSTLDALLNVRGIGPKTLERLRFHLIVEPNQPASVNRKPVKE